MLKKREDIFERFTFKARALKIEKEDQLEGW
jgi:hypothetical protein